MRFLQIKKSLPLIYMIAPFPFVTITFIINALVIISQKSLVYKDTATPAFHSFSFIINNC